MKKYCLSCDSVLLEPIIDADVKVHHSLLTYSLDIFEAWACPDCGLLHWYNKRK